MKELKEELKKEVMKHAQERGHPFIDGVIENKFKEYGIGEKKRKCLKKI